MTSLPETLSDFLRASAAQPRRLLLMTSVLLMKEGEDVVLFIISVYFREKCELGVAGSLFNGMNAVHLTAR